jgi:hypothetical protein
MMLDKEAVEWIEKLDPQRIYRECDARTIFGYSTTILKEKIKDGSIPKPKLLAPPPSRAAGWYGWQLIQHRKESEAKQAEWAAAAKALYETRKPPPDRKGKKPAKRRATA